MHPLEEIKSFHGHISSFAVLGYKIGLLGLKIMGANRYTGVFIIADTKNIPPFSGMVDGLQLSTGCTFGKGNIRITNEDKNQVTFSASTRTMKIKIKEEIINKLPFWTERFGEEEVAQKLFYAVEEDLFEVDLPQDWAILY